MASKTENIDKLFRRFDKDGNGRISADELRHILELLGQGITPAEIGKVLREVDTNRDGIIDYKEFARWAFGGPGRRSRKPSLVPQMEAAVALEAAQVSHADSESPFAICATFSYTGTIKFWDLKAGRQIDAMGTRTPKNQRFTNVEDDIKLAETIKNPHKANLNCFAIDWDCRSCITGSEDCTLKMWNFHGNVQRTYGSATHAGRAEVTCVDVDWASNRMVSGDMASRLQIWRLDNSEVQHTLQNDDKSGVRCLSVSWNQGRALCGAGNLLQMWDIKSVQAAPEIPPDSLFRLSGHQGPVVALLVDWAEQIAMSASADKTLRRWDLRAGVLLQTISTNMTEITCMSGISPGLRLVAGDTEGQLKEWDTKSGTCTRTLSGHTDQITTLSSMHKDYVVSGSRDGTIRVWSVMDSRCLRTMQNSEVAGGHWVIGVEAVAEEALLTPTFRTIDAGQFDELPTGM
eukprot:TRINITY_DN19707_c0_g1_i1.p1 TRINITY_DN19707_c0_g1~~TRINITY_DN19707_c0_g1_i1.p1  ORF type:complete len:487 (+),score=78.32 TRINITY_DN19707_c0_g1_i1:82-1461(+)